MSTKHILAAIAAMIAAPAHALIIAFVFNQAGGQMLFTDKQGPCRTDERVVITFDASGPFGAHEALGCYGMGTNEAGQPAAITEFYGQPGQAIPVAALHFVDNQKKAK